MIITSESNNEDFLWLWSLYDDYHNEYTDGEHDDYYYTRKHNYAIKKLRTDVGVDTTPFDVCAYGAFEVVDINKFMVAKLSR